MEFEIGDFVVYTPNLPALLSPKLRKEHWGYIHDIDANYIHFQPYLDHTFSEKAYKILPSAISHNPFSKKYIRHVFITQCLSILPQAIEAREARRVMLFRTPFSIHSPGPAQLVQTFITSHSRTKANLSTLFS